MKTEIQAVFGDVAGYISDHEWCISTITKAYESGEPESYLEMMYEDSSPTRRGDIRIILNRIRRI